MELLGIKCFLSEENAFFINNLRKNEESLLGEKALICDSRSAIIRAIDQMPLHHESREHLQRALSFLSDYQALLTDLSKPV